MAQKKYPKQRMAHFLMLMPISAMIALGLSGITLPNGVSEFNQTRLLELGLLGWLSTLLIGTPRIREAIIHKLYMKRIPSIGLLLFWGLGLISALTAHWPQYALQDWAHDLLLALSILIVTALASIETSRFVKMLLAGIVVGIGVALARFFIQLTLTVTLNVVTPLNVWWSPYSNPRFIAQAIVWILPLLTALPALWPLYRTRAVVAAHAICIGAWMLLFWSGSRAEILSLVTSAVVIVVLMRHYAFSFIARMALQASAGFMLWVVTRLTISVSNISDTPIPLFRTGVSGRDWLLERSAQLLTQHPWLGIGPAHFSVYNNLPATHQTDSHPHNLILQIAVEWGLPAALILVGLLWMFVRRQYLFAHHRFTNIALTDDIRHVMGIPLLLTLLAVLFTSLLDGIHIMPLSLIVGVPVLGLMVDANLPVTDVPVSQSKFSGTFLVVGLLSCWTLIALNIICHLDCLTYPTEAEKIIKGYVGYDNPRFWAQGRVPLEKGCLESGRYQNGMDTLLGRSVDGPSTTEQYWR